MLTLLKFKLEIKEFDNQKENKRNKLKRMY